MITNIEPFGLNKFLVESSVLSTSKLANNPLVADSSRKNEFKNFESHNQSSDLLLFFAYKGQNKLK